MTLLRPSFEKIYMDLAVGLSNRSTCRRLQVGCAIVSPDFRRIYAVGYNGGASGMVNDCDRFGAEAVGNCGCLHAEENAIINCDVSRLLPKLVLVTHLPCIMCAKRMINMGGVTEVHYLNDYRDHSSLELLAAASIRCKAFVSRP